MRVDSCSFGQMTVGGTTYTSDVIVYPDRVQDSWWRKDGHLLDMVDLAEILESQPRVLVLGTGHYGGMDVPHDLRNRLKAYGLRIHVARTPEAVDRFNSLEGAPGLVGAFHLTC